MGRLRRKLPDKSSSIEKSIFIVVSKIVRVLMNQWIEVWATDDIDEEDVMRFDH
jgi:hypothetical protein